jgi:hypothetical protein
MADSIDAILQNNESQSKVARYLSRRNSNTDLRDSTLAKQTPASPDLSPEPRRESTPTKSYSPRSGGRRSLSERDHRVRDFIEEEDETSCSSPTTTMTSPRTNGSGNDMITDFFSPDVFQLVIHNPTTAYRFLRFCQSRNCGESMEFLQKVCQFTGQGRSCCTTHSPAP